jgi:hypothetical protein
MLRKPEPFDTRRTIVSKMQDGTFPRQVQISDYCRGWCESAIKRWMSGEANSVTDWQVLADRIPSRNHDWSNSAAAFPERRARPPTISRHSLPMPFY